MRVLGVDLGRKRIGLAVSDTTGTIATPWSVLPRSGDVARDHRAIRDVAAELEAERVVVGLPRSLDGRHGPAARAASGEAARLGEVLGLPVELEDERFTTAQAERSLREAGLDGRRRRQVVDKVAAAVLLQGWLDRHAGDSAPPDPAADPQENLQDA